MQPHARPIRWREEEVGGNLGDRSYVGNQARQELTLRRNSKRVEERSQRKVEEHLRDVSPLFIL